jgi:lysozyme
MRPSATCENLIKGYESCRLVAYKPTPDDVWTIGWGATGPDIKKGTVWTQKQADDRFRADLDAFGKGVATWLAGKPTTQAQFDAMVSLAYNIGMGAFSGSTLLQYHKAGRFADAADQFLRWNKQAGVVLKGLTARRQAERALYLGVRK